MPIRNWMTRTRRMMAVPVRSECVVFFSMLRDDVLTKRVPPTYKRSLDERRSMYQNCSSKGFINSFIKDNIKDKRAACQVTKLDKVAVIFLRERSGRWQVPLYP